MALDRLRAGMILLSVEGVPTQGMSLDEANDLIARYRSMKDTLQVGSRRPRVSVKATEYHFTALALQLLTCVGL